MVVKLLDRKNIIIPLIIGLLFSFFYFQFPIKFFVLLIGGFTVAFVSKYNINIGIAIGILALPFMPNEIALLYLIMIVMIFLFNQLYRDNYTLNKSFTHIPILFYVFAIIISTFTSLNISGSFRDLIIHISAIGLLFVIVNTVDNKEKFNFLLITLVFTATVVSIYGLYQYKTGVAIEQKWVDVASNPDLKTRVFSVFGNPNILAEYLIMIIPISIALFWYTNKLFKKIIFLITTLILVLTLVLTFARGGWIGFAFGIIVFVFLIEKRLLLSFIPIGIISMFVLPPSVINRIQTIGSLQDSSNAYRIKMWKITLEIIKDHWASGVGFGYIPFKQTFETYIRTMPIYHAHNTYLETMAEMGIPGIIVFFILLFVIYKYGIKSLLKTDDKYLKVVIAGAISGLSAILFHGLVESVLYLPRIIILFWIIISFIIVGMNLTNNKNEDKI